MTHSKRLSIAITAGIFAVVTLVLVLLSVFRDQSLTRLQKAGVIKIGYAVEAPYVFLKPGGEVTGEEAELTKVIVSRLGIQRIEWHLIEFDELIPSLETGQVDAVVAGMFITPERATRISFSNPTFHVQQGLLVAAGNPRQLHSYAQAVAHPEIKIAVITGAVEEGMLLELGLDDSQIVRVPDALTGRVAVENGIADGLALSAITIRWMAAQDQLGRTAMAQPFEQNELPKYLYLGYGAVAFRQEDQKLRTAWNVALEGFIESPEHLKLMGDFGFTSTELPGTVTTQEILKQP